jgi:hypothetical protein
MYLGSGGAMVLSNGTFTAIKSAGGTDYTNYNIEVRTSTGDAGIGFHNGGANASTLIYSRSSGIFEFLNNPISSYQQIKAHNLQTVGYIYGLNGNTINSYSGIAIRGEKNGYGGISFNRGDGTYLGTMMFGSDRAYWGLYDETLAQWNFYTPSWTSTSRYWYMVGTLTVSANIIAYYSDERLKTKLGNIQNALDKIDKLNGFYYVQNELGNELMGFNGKVQLALSAQEVKVVAPEVVSLAPFDMKPVDGQDEPVSRSGEDYMTIQYERLVPLLVEGLKEAHSRIKHLEARLG